MKAALLRCNFGLRMCRYYFLRPSVFPPLLVKCEKSVQKTAQTFILILDADFPFVNRKTAFPAGNCSGYFILPKNMLE